MVKDEEYKRVVDALFEKHQSVANVGFKGNAYKPGLEAMCRLDNALGRPSDQFRTVHVAGTNGKGSVSSMLAAALAATGLRVGLYTSPHLVDFRERMKIVRDGNFEEPTKDYVLDFLDKFSTDLEGLSFFEVTTGMAFRWFADEKVDLAVIEVGLGGRLDSTNIIIPELSVVTSIGLDHCAILGDTRAKIAGEKAGIFKPGVPAVVGEWDEETGPVFEAAAGAVHAPLFFADDFEVDGGYELDLKGPCQEMNLRTVLAALDILGVEADKDAIENAGHITGLRARWEKLLDNPETICDIGHNPPALTINFKRLEEMKRPLVIVYGIMADKDLTGISHLMPSGAKYILCAPATQRSMDVMNLSNRLAELRPDLDTTVAGSVAEAVDMALKIASETPDSLVYIGGSTFVVSEAIQHIENK